MTSHLLAQSKWGPIIQPNFVLPWPQCWLHFSLPHPAIQCIRGGHSSFQGQAIKSPPPIHLVNVEARFTQSGLPCITAPCLNFCHTPFFAIFIEKKKKKEKHRTGSKYALVGTIASRARVQWSGLVTAHTLNYEYCVVKTLLTPGILLSSRRRIRCIFAGR